MQVNLTSAEFLFLFNVLKDEIRTVFDDETIDVYDSIITKFNAVLVATLEKSEHDAAFAAWNRAIEKVKKLDREKTNVECGSQQCRKVNYMVPGFCADCHECSCDDHEDEEEGPCTVHLEKIKQRPQQRPCPDMPKPPQKRH